MIRRQVFAAVAALSLLPVSAARADEAIVVVGGPYAEPPRTAPIAPYEPSSYESPPRERYRAPFRLVLGPSVITTGKGAGVGLGIAADFGAGVVGGRLSAAWLRGEGTDRDGRISNTGDSVGHYTGELTIDLIKRGSIHPVLGVGGGVLHVIRPDQNGAVGVGTLRASLEYFAPLEEADLRIGLDATAGLAGPGSDVLKDLRGYGLFGFHAALGF